MVAYEFYWLDPVKGYELVGILPERRENPARITQESVMNWVENVFANKLSAKDIYFIQVTIDEYRVYREDFSAYSVPRDSAES